jgi:hypothetical protein
MQSHPRGWWFHFTSQLEKAVISHAQDQIAMQEVMVSLDVSLSLWNMLTGS